MKDFKKFLQSLDLKDSTIRRHVWNLKNLRRNVPSFEEKDLLTFFEKLKKDHAPSYLTSLASTIRRWGQHKNIDSFKDFPMFGKRTKFVKTTMSNEEIESFLNLPRVRNEAIKTYQLWTMFFSVLAYTGMRPGEVAKLKREDLDLERRLFIIRDTKTNDSRLVPIPDFLTQDLKNHLAGLNDGLLFPKKNGKSVNTSDWFYHFQKRIRRLGIKRKNLTCYSLRHSLITRLIEKDINLFKIQKLVGHRRIATTAAYCHLTVEPLREVVNHQLTVKRNEKPS